MWSCDSSTWEAETGKQCSRLAQGTALVTFLIVVTKYLSRTAYKRKGFFGLGVSGDRVCHSRGGIASTSVGTARKQRDDRLD